MVVKLRTLQLPSLHPSQSWVSEIKREENTRHFRDPETQPGGEDHLPPVRGSDSCPHRGKVGPSGLWGRGVDRGRVVAVAYRDLGLVRVNPCDVSVQGFPLLVTPGSSSSSSLFLSFLPSPLLFLFYFWCGTGVYLGPHTRRGLCP